MRGEMWGLLLQAWASVWNRHPLVSLGTRLAWVSVWEPEPSLSLPFLDSRLGAVHVDWQSVAIRPRSSFAAPSASPNPPPNGGFDLHLTGW